MPYKLLEHTSDLFIEAENKDFPSTLADIAIGMFSQMGGDYASETDSITVEASSDSPEGLVVAFLSEIVAEVEIQSFTPKSITISSYDSEKNSISALIKGERKPAENIIKAVTYHELLVEDLGDKYRIRVLFDI